MRRDSYQGPSFRDELEPRTAGEKRLYRQGGILGEIQYVGRRISERLVHDNLQPMADMTRIWHRTVSAQRRINGLRLLQYQHQSIFKHHFSTTCPKDAQHASRPRPLPETKSISSDEVLEAKHTRRPSLRERLREWDEPLDPSMSWDKTSTDLPIAGQLSNSTTRPQSGDAFTEAPPDDIGYSNNLPLFDQGELTDVGDNRPYLLRGDLVELTVMGGRQPELAVFVRELEIQSQFYTMSGKYVHRTPKSIKFYVPGFVDAKELDSLLPYLPTEDIVGSKVDVLQTFTSPVPRELGASLVQKLMAFWNESETIYRGAIAQLDHAHQILADRTTLSYLTLEQMANKLLPTSVKKDAAGQYSKQALYAVHQAVARDEIGFMPNRGKQHRTFTRWEIRSVNEVETVRLVVDWVRQYQDEQVRPLKHGTKEARWMRQFIEKAQRLIDKSRETRPTTTSGTIGPSSTKSKDPSSLVQSYAVETFNDKDTAILNFLESWVALRSFVISSMLHSIGCAILHATQRYTSANNILDMSTGWMFLQEIGVVAPWESRVGFDARVPGTGRRLQYEGVANAAALWEAKKGLSDDMESLRVHWKNTTVYCVDDANAHEIDDGVSVESVEGSSTEYWLHVHVADPAAFIKEDGKIANKAKDMAETMYFPEQVFTMLPSAFVQNTVSLAPDRPALTFSTRLNLEGDILETKATSGIVQHVVYLTPQTMEEILGNDKQSNVPATVLSVGGEFPINTQRLKERRLLRKADEFSEEEKAQLRLLHQIGQARQRKRQARGGMSVAMPMSSINVSLGADKVSPEILSRNQAHHHRGDPVIQMQSDPLDENGEALTSGLEGTINNLMLTACETAAIWCSERNIPVPYRITPYNPDRQDPAAYYREHILPHLDATGKVPVNVGMNYLRLLGSVIPSTTPGPHIAIGVEKYTKCTSPLRRYGDLLLHWQVNAALREEARTGESLIGSTREDYLPFSRAKVDALLPYLDIRERSIASHKRDAQRHWTMQLLTRAILFKEAEMPKTLDFMVNSLTRIGSSMSAGYDVSVSGILPVFATGCDMILPDWLKPEDVNIGDHYEVELTSLNTYTRRIECTALRLAKKGGEEGS